METRLSSHSVHSLQVHLVRITKYRHHVLQGEVHLRCRDILRQVCNSLDIQILKSVVSKDHVHLHLRYPTKLIISEMVRRLKGRNSRMLLSEFPELHRHNWDNHFWGIGYGSWSTGHLTEEMLNSYLDHHNDRPNTDENFILE